jgi:hypothetical protein
MSETNNHLLTQQQSLVAVKFLIAILRWYSIHPAGVRVTISPDLALMRG